VTNKDVRTIKSATRVLEILEYFDSGHRTATVMDLSRSLAYPQSSTSELLRCLTRLGYLHYDRYRRTYSPTARVALLGSWVEPMLFRGGTVLSALDRISEVAGETVVLSTASNYVVQHLHVVEGTGEGAVPEHAGTRESLLHSPEGRLLLSSYQDAHIRSALHRLNAEEEDPERRVRINETVDELVALRRQGWLMVPEARADGTGTIAVLLPARPACDRLVLSVLARLRRAAGPHAARPGQSGRPAADRRPLSAHPRVPAHPRCRRRRQDRGGRSRYHRPRGR
jgi:IclR family transcriptional regulator, KDG regulon repressor